MLEESIRFHGHMCSGLALGFRASQLALRILDTDGARDDLIVAVETDTCSVDAIQMLTGCTFGNGKLSFQDHAKSAYSFWQAGRETVLRIVARPSPAADDPAFWANFEKVQRGTATSEERGAFSADQQTRSQRILEAPDEDLFEVQEVAELQPARPLVTPPVVCDGCGEATMAHRVQNRAGTVLCVSCGQRRVHPVGAR